jgi:threonyl-tRNA synthetase
MIYKARPRSYRDLPLRLSEYGHVYRFERSGELAGLLRVRGMTMNDAHLYVQPEKAKQEFIKVMELHLDYYRLLEFSSWYMRLSLSDESSGKYLPRPELWKKAERLCVEAMDEMELEYETVRGEAAFYGPKVDVQVKNVVGREETASTNQVDPMAAQQDRFDMTYVGDDGALHRPWVLHRAPLGTHERFLAFLIEHFGGAFPTWLAPEQVRVIPVSPEQLEYAHKVEKTLFDRMVRVELDDSSDTFNKKIRNGVTRKIPILLVVGGREAEQNTVTVRRYKIKKQQTLALDTFLAQLAEEIRTRRWVKPEGGV